MNLEIESIWNLHCWKIISCTLTFNVLGVLDQVLDQRCVLVTTFQTQSSRMAKWLSKTCQQHFTADQLQIFGWSQVWKGFRWLQARSRSQMYYENIWKRGTKTTEPDRTLRSLTQFDWSDPKTLSIGPTSILLELRLVRHSYPDLASDFTPAGGSAVRRRMSLDTAGYGKPKLRRQSCSRICWLQQILICSISLDFHVNLDSKAFSCSKLQFQFIPLFPATVPCCWCFRSWAMSAMSYVKLPQLPPPRVASMWCSSVEPDTISTAPVEPRWNPVEHEIFTSGHRRKVLSLAKWWNGQKMRNENYGILWHILKITDMIIYEFMNTMDYEILWIWMIWRLRKSMEKSSWTWMRAGTSN